MASSAAEDSEQLKSELFEACQNGTWQDVTRLLRSGASLYWEHPSEGWNTLSYAIRGNNHQVAENILLERDSRGMHNSFMIMERLPNGECPIHMACRLGHVALVDLIIHWGGLRVDLEDRDGETALHIACMHGHDSVLNRLVNSEHFQVNHKNRRYETALQKACLKGHVGIVKTLLQKNADVNQEHPSGQSPLQIAISHAHWDIVDLLLEQQDLDVNYKDSSDHSALQDVCRLREQELSSQLPQAASTAQPGSPDQECTASNQGSLKAIKSLLQAGAEVSPVDNDGWTPLCTASQIGDTLVVRILLDHGAQACVKNACDPIRLAENQGHEHIVHLLKDSIEDCG